MLSSEADSNQLDRTRLRRQWLRIQQRLRILPCFPGLKFLASCAGFVSLHRFLPFASNSCRPFGEPRFKPLNRWVPGRWRIPDRIHRIQSRPGLESLAAGGGLAGPPRGVCTRSIFFTFPSSIFRSCRTIHFNSRANSSHSLFRIPSLWLCDTCRSPRMSPKPRSRAGPLSFPELCWFFRQSHFAPALNRSAADRHRRQASVATPKRAPGERGRIARVRAVRLHEIPDADDPRGDPIASTPSGVLATYRYQLSPTVRTIS